MPVFCQDPKIKSGAKSWNDLEDRPFYEDADGSIKTLDPKYLPETETNIYTYDSLDQVPADLPEGSFVAVPSEGAGGGGLPVVELSTDISSIFTTGGYIELTTDDCAKMDEIFSSNVPYTLNFIVPEEAGNMSFKVLMSIGGVTGLYNFSGGFMILETAEYKFSIVGANGEYTLFLIITAHS